MNNLKNEALVNVKELWAREFSWRKNIFKYFKHKKIGELMLRSARSLKRLPDRKPEALPLCKVKPLHGVKRFKQIFESIREKGYIPTGNDMITVYLKNRKLFVCDGHRRLSCIYVLGKEKWIRVKVSPERDHGCSSPGLLFRARELIDL